MTKSPNNLLLLFSILIFLGCGENQKLKFNTDKNLYINAQQILENNYSLINETIENPNKYSGITPLNPKNIEQLKGMGNQDREFLLKVFEEKKVSDISLYDSTCFLFLIRSENGFFNSKLYYYLFSKNDDCINKIKKDFNIEKEELLDAQWHYIVRQESLAN